MIKSLPEVPSRRNNFNTRPMSLWRTVVDVVLRLWGHVLTSDNDRGANIFVRYDLVTTSKAFDTATCWGIVVDSRLLKNGSYL